MANKTVVFNNQVYAGTAGLTLLLISPTDGSIGNGSGDTLTAGSNGLFSCVVTENITGWWHVVVKNGATAILEGGQVYFPSDTLGTYRVDVIASVDEIVDGVWDEVLTGATHNVASSAGRRLRQLASVIVRAGTAQGPGTGNNQIQLDAGASATNGDYDPGLIFIETGTGAGQARLILQYNGTTKVATVDRDWRVNPDNTSEFVILADAGRQSVNEGLAQAGSSTTITLNTSASTSDDAYNGQLIFIRSGTGQDQVALVEDYVGSTKVATTRTRSATGQWAVVPDTTSAYVMIPNLTWTIAEMQAGLATSSGVTAAFTEIKGASWSSASDTLEKISDAAGTGGATVIVSPLSAQAPERVVGTTIDIAVGDRSPVSVDVFDANDAAVDLSAQGNLEVCIESRNNTDLQVVAHASITIGGTGNRRATWTPNAAAVATVDKHRWSLRTESAKKVLAYGPWVVSRVALKDA